MVDLHTHSSYSDGTFSPLQLIQAAAQIGLSAIALTDHDTTGGLDEFIRYGKEMQVPTVPGVEISVDSKLPGNGHIHILGLFINHRSRELNEKLAFLVKHRSERARKMVDALNSLGIPVTLSELMAEVGEGSIGRPHVARVLMKHRVVNSVQEAFDRFLSKGKPAYIEKVKLSEAETIQLIHSAEGLAILAHPHYMNFATFADTRKKILQLKEMGLDGVEAFYPEMPAEFHTALIELAHEADLVISGGTDFHGTVKPDIQLGYGKHRKFNVPDTIYRNLLERKQTLTA